MPPLSPLELVCCVYVCSAAADDVRRRRISNTLNAAALCSALMLHLMSAAPAAALAAWSAGALAGAAVFLPLYLMRGMGAGDLKLMGASGAFLGAGLVWQVACAAALCGGVLALAMLGLQHWQGTPRKPSVPYGTAICAGTVAACLQNA